MVLSPYRRDLVLIMPQGHMRATQTAVKLADVMGRHLDVRIQVRSFEAVCRMVGLCEPSVVLEIDEPWAERDLQVCVRNGAPLSGFAAVLVDHLRKSGGYEGS